VGRGGGWSPGSFQWARPEDQKSSPASCMEPTGSTCSPSTPTRAGDHERHVTGPGADEMERRRMNSLRPSEPHLAMWLHALRTSWKSRPVGELWAPADVAEGGTPTHEPFSARKSACCERVDRVRGLLEMAPLPPRRPGRRQQEAATSSRTTDRLGGSTGRASASASSSRSASQQRLNPSRAATDDGDGPRRATRTLGPG